MLPVLCTIVSSAPNVRAVIEPKNIRAYLFAVQPPLCCEPPCSFPWWNERCRALIDDLDARGGKRFVSDADLNQETRNWLHVTASTPLKRAQYEMRWLSAEQCLHGIVRFGLDCEGPPGHAHGGAIATVADAATATATFMSAGRWGVTTKLECNYREMLPVDTAVQLEAIH